MLNQAPKSRITALLLCLTFLVAACASRVLDYEDGEKMEQNQEYENLIKVKEIPPPPPAPPSTPIEPSVSEGSSSQLVVNVGTTSSQRKAGTGKAPLTSPPTPGKAVKGGKAVMQVRQPELEDAEGFIGRRPTADPFRVGEKVTYDISYFKMKAGEMDLAVGPFVEVNGAKAYNFKVDLRTAALFSSFYSVDDQAETFVNFDTLLPYNLSIKIKESKQLAEVRTFFDWQTMTANYWKKRYTKEKGETNKKLQWKIEPFSQNTVSAIFYLRNFSLVPGKKLAFRVADEGKNIIFKGEVLRREKIDTAIGELNTVVVRPEFQVDGVFKPAGEILFWLTDDERKFIVRIDSKIKIGTLRAKLKSITYGE